MRNSDRTFGASIRTVPSPQSLSEHAYPPSLSTNQWNAVTGGPAARHRHGQTLGQHGSNATGPNVMLFSIYSVLHRTSLNENLPHPPIRCRVRPSANLDQASLTSNHVCFISISIISRFMAIVPRSTVAWFAAPSISNYTQIRAVKLAAISAVEQIAKFRSKSRPKTYYDRTRAIRRLPATLIKEFTQRSTLHASPEDSGYILKFTLIFLHHLLAACAMWWSACRPTTSIR